MEKRFRNSRSQTLRLHRARPGLERIWRPIRTLAGRDRETGVLILGRARQSRWLGNRRLAARGAGIGRGLRSPNRREDGHPMNAFRDKLGHFYQPKRFALRRHELFRLFEAEMAIDRAGHFEG